LSALLPGKVAVWSSEHDPKCTAWPKLGEKPKATFTQQQLQDYPVIVVTHKFYLDVNGHRASTFVRGGVKGDRSLDRRAFEGPFDLEPRTRTSRQDQY
jgi:hypothetical protein